MLDRKEILRYLGAEKGDGALEQMIDQAEKEVLSASSPKQVSRRVAIEVDPLGVSLPGARWESRDLAAHLSHCKEAFLFACTLGQGVDVLLKRTELIDMPLVPVIQACAAQYVEFIADKAQEEMEAYASAHGSYLRPRFSPGFGDFSLTCQDYFFSVLEIPKKIGVCLTENHMMLPMKSITAVIGISPDPSLCHVGNCMTCAKKECPFRKEKSHG